MDFQLRVQVLPCKFKERGSKLDKLNFLSANFMKKRTRLNREAFNRDDKLNHRFVKATEMDDCTSLTERGDATSLPASTKKEIDPFFPEKRITIIYLFFQLIVTVLLSFVGDLNCCPIKPLSKQAE